MISKKAIITAQGLLIAMMVFFGIILVFTHFYGDIQENYDVTVEGNVSSRFYDTVDKYSEEMYQKSLKMSNATEGSERITYEQAGGVELVTAAIWNIVKTPFKVIDIVYAMITDLAILLELPLWLVTIVLSVILTIIVFVAVNAVFRRGT